MLRKSASRVNLNCRDRERIASRMTGPCGATVHRLMAAIAVQLLMAAVPLLLSLLAPQARAAEIPATRVAVVPFAEVGDKVDAGAGAVVTELLTNELINGGRYQMIERAQLEKVLQEMKWQEDQRVDDATAATAGKQIGAAVIVTGSVMKLGGGYTIAARFVEVETSRAALAVSRTVSGAGAIPGTVPGMVTEFLRKEDEQAAKLADEGQRLVRQGRQETGRDRLERLVRRYPRAKAVPEALQALARMDMAAFHYALASERLNDLLDTFPGRGGNGPAMYDLAECYYLSAFPPPESAETVLRDLDRVMERFRNPGDPFAATKARVALCRKARELYRAVLAEEPGTPQKSRIESRLKSLGEILGD